MNNATDCQLLNISCNTGNGQLPAGFLERYNLVVRLAKIEVVLHGASFMCVYTSIVLLFFLRLKHTVKLFLHKQLLISYLLTEVIFFSKLNDIVNRVVDYPGACTFFMILSYYFNMALFSNMMVEGLYICMKLSSVFDTHSKRRQCLMYAVIAWSVPAVIIGLELAASYTSFEVAAQYECGFSQEDAWLYKGPVAAILIVNFINCVYILHISVKRICVMKQYSNSMKKTLGTIRTMMVLYPLLGVTFIVGFAVNEDKTFVFSYIYVILNGCIGVLFFIFHILYDPMIRRAILKEVFGQKSMDGTSMATTRYTYNSATNTKLDSEGVSTVQSTIPIKRLENIEMNYSPNLDNRGFKADEKNVETSSNTS